MAEALLERMTAEIKLVSADRAYDQEKVYRTAHRRGVTILTIPPRRDARIWQHGNGAAPTPSTGCEGGVTFARWDTNSGRPKGGITAVRSLQTARFCLKTIFGDRLRARGLARQKTEARITCAAPGGMTRLGKLESYRVA